MVGFELRGLRFLGPSGFGVRVSLNPGTLGCCDLGCVRMCVSANLPGFLEQ